LFNRLKNLLGHSGSGNAAGTTGGSNKGGAYRRGGSGGAPVLRQSNGLEQFFSVMRDRGTLSVLDFAGASQENISFITSLGHHFASQDFVRSIEQTFGEDPLQNQSDPVLLDQFISENLSFAPESYDGVLAWDGLQFLSPHLLQIVVDRVYEAMRPDACLLAFFNANEKAREVPLYNYRMADNRTLSLVQRGVGTTGQHFNNRSIEKLFHRYQSVKFFLARDFLREIIVRR